MDVALLFVIILAVTSPSDVRISAVPLSGALNPIVVDSNGGGGGEDGGAEEGPIPDDFTTHGLERLSSAATCLVAGVEYTHGQQIYRSDPCEFCLCLDGEMFCWWQDCPPAMEGPCKDRGPFTPCLNAPSSSTMPSKSTVAAAMTTTTTTTMMMQATSTDTDNSTDNDDNSSTYSEESYTEETAATTADPKFCVVMGRKYGIGEKLPHDTGNCVECVCGAGAKVTCSPHQCAPAGEDINDYRPPGPRQQAPDVF